MYKVLITDAVHEDMISLFKEQNIDINYAPFINQEEVEKIISNYDLLVINSKIQVDIPFINKASKLKVVGRLGSGKEIIDLDYAKSKNIIFHNSPEGNRDAVAEHCVGMILSLLNHIPKSFEEIKKHIWSRELNRGNELKNKTIALIGYGNTGKETAKRLRSFECKIIVYDKYLKNISNEYIEEVEMETIYNEADIVSIHLPLTSITQHLVDEQFIAKFKNNFYLINTSRGKIVDEEQVIKALEIGKLKGFATDVLLNEKFESYTEKDHLRLEKLISLNTIITPHIAGWTYESKQKLAQILAKKMIMSISCH